MSPRVPCGTVQARNKSLRHKKQLHNISLGSKLHCAPPHILAIETPTTFLSAITSTLLMFLMVWMFHKQFLNGAGASQTVSQTFITGRMFHIQTFTMTGALKQEVRGNGP